MGDNTQSDALTKHFSCGKLYLQAQKTTTNTTTNTATIHEEVKMKEPIRPYLDMCSWCGQEHPCTHALEDNGYTKMAICRACLQETLRHFDELDNPASTETVGNSGR